VDALPQTFPQWQEVAAGDPDKAASLFFSRLETLPLAARKAALAWLPEPSALAAQFRLASGASMPGVLAGVPYLLKDLYHAEGTPTCAGSDFYAEIVEYPGEEAALVQDLRQAGAVLAGKTHLNEFAYGLDGTNRWTGDCPHPRNPRTLSGGSSSGSAWAVGAGLVPFAVGTDTGGSVRVPAAWCGIFGLRVPPCNWSQEGVVPLSPTLDTPGWFANTPEDLCAATDALLGGAGKDTPQRLRGLYLDDLTPFANTELGAACERVASALGAEFDPETIAWLRHALKQAEPAYAVLQSREAWHVHEQFLDAMCERYSPEVWKLIDRGRRWNAHQIELAEEEALRINSAFEDFFDNYDVLYIPATHTTAPPKELVGSDFKRELLRLNAPASLGRLPVLTLPIRLSDTQSGGLQVIFPSLEKMNLSQVFERLGAFY